MSEEEDLHRLLAALVEQYRALATRIAGDPDREVPCHFCGSPVPLWENLLVLQFTGVAAHVICPPEALRLKLAQVGPSPDFPYDDFSSAVDRRLTLPVVPACSGIIDRSSTN